MSELCPKCGTEMEYKQDWMTVNEESYYLYQCPHCKNVEVEEI